MAGSRPPSSTARRRRARWRIARNNRKRTFGALGFGVPASASNPASGGLDSAARRRLLEERQQVLLERRGGRGRRLLLGAAGVAAEHAVERGVSRGPAGQRLRRGRRRRVVAEHLVERAAADLRVVV